MAASTSSSDGAATDAVKDNVDQDTTGGVQTPNIDPKTLVIERKAIRDAEQANEIGIGLEQGNKTRNDTNAIIVAQYDGEQPFVPSDLEAAGEDWRNNFPTGFMSGIIDRVTPAPVSLIDSSRYLTASRLDPKKFKDADRKSQLFQSAFTKRVRSWQGWRPFCYALCQEEVLIGYTMAAWTDEYNWRPRLYRSNEGFVPEGTEQNASSVQALSLKQSFLIHELVEIIADLEPSKIAGWDIDNTCYAINHAMPKNPSKAGKDETSTGEDQRSYEDTIREGNQGASHQNGAKVINVRHVFAVEPNAKDETDGKFYQRVTHYIIDRDSKKKLFCKESRFERMSDVVTLFTLQPGNGKYYGSKGLGKILVNLHIAIERARNIAFDQLYMAGMLIIHDKDGKGSPTIQLKVRHPFALISTSGEISQEQIQANVEAFMELDTKLTSIAEQAANAYIPNKLSDIDNRDRTATEASIDAQRDQQAKVAYLARFWGQFADLVNSMQRKMSDPETIDEEAKAFQAELKEAGLTEEEIKALADAPAAEVQDLSDMNSQKIIAAAQTLTGNPRIDQEKLLRRYVTALTSALIADDLILQDAIDPTVEAENVRQQMIENEMFMLGTSMNVSPRDNHEVHLKTGLSQLQEAAPKIAKIAVNAPEILDHISAALVHFNAHVQMWQQSGAQPETLQPYIESIQKADELLKQLAGYVAKVKAGQVTDAVAQAQQTMSGAPAGVVPGDQQQQPQQPDPNAPDPQLRAEALAHIVDSMDFAKLPFDVQNKILQMVGLPTSTQPPPSAGQTPGTMGQPMPMPGRTAAPKIMPVQPIDPAQIAMQIAQRHQPTPVAAPASGMQLAAKLAGTSGQPRTAASHRADAATELPESPLPA